jgi:hypothetical protein
MARITIQDLDAWIAHREYVRDALYAEAERRAAIAQGVLDAHRHLGHSRITVTVGDKVDWFVNLDDSRGQDAAVSIEYGRTGARGRGTSQGVGALQAAMGR